MHVVSGGLGLGLPSGDWTFTSKLCPSHQPVHAPLAYALPPRLGANHQPGFFPSGVDVSLCTWFRRGMTDDTSRYETKPSTTKATSSQ